MFGRKPKPPEIESTAFSDFIRNASAAEKKRVYTQVMKRATERQNKVLEAAEKKQRDDRDGLPY